MVAGWRGHRWVESDNTEWYFERGVGEHCKATVITAPCGEEIVMATDDLKQLCGDLLQEYFK